MLNDKNETIYRVEMLKFDEFERGTLTGRREPVIAYTGTWEQCAKYWRDYASGFQDYDGPATGQNYSAAYYWRIVEA